VLCVLSGKGGAATATALTEIVRDTHADKAILIGIAGGFADQKMEKGDVVVAKTILAYDFGKLVRGKYIRRPELDWQCDPGLIAHTMLAARKPWFEWIKVSRPDSQRANASVVRDGYVASGDKVVDDQEHPFFREASNGMEEIHAVEMEAAGAGAAVRFRQTMGVLRFLMIKGISDQPHGGESQVEVEGMEQRAQWTRYAANAAAALMRGLIEEMAAGEIAGSAAPDVTDRAERTREVADDDETAGLYQWFKSNWWPALSRRREERVSAAELVDWLLRSLIPELEHQPYLITALHARARDSHLPPHLPDSEEQAIRQLRNLGLIRHDGRSLFTPTRSLLVEPTPTGRLLIALRERKRGRDADEIVRNVVRELLEVGDDTRAIELLRAIETGTISSIRGEKDAARRLRNLHLIAHDEEFLPSPEKLRLTGLGRHVLSIATLSVAKVAGGEAREVSITKTKTTHQGGVNVSGGTINMGGGNSCYGIDRCFWASELLTDTVSCQAIYSRRRIFSNCLLARMRQNWSFGSGAHIAL
jgi:nucleoside phosphorylase